MTSAKFQLGEAPVCGVISRGPGPVCSEEQAVQSPYGFLKSYEIRGTAPKSAERPLFLFLNFFYNSNVISGYGVVVARAHGVRAVPVRFWVPRPKDYYMESEQFGSSESKEQNKVIHPDFREEQRVSPDFSWFWNYEDFREYLRRKGIKPKFFSSLGYSHRDAIKVAFPFEDPQLMNGCLYMAKIGKNMTSNPDTNFFGIAYGIKEDLEEIKTWASRFPRFELITNLAENLETDDKSKHEFIQPKTSEE